jgi:hypothetical protein
VSINSLIFLFISFLIGIFRKMKNAGYLEKIKASGVSESRG